MGDAKKPKITVWTKTYCPWCNGLKDFLKANKFQFEERDVVRHPKYFDEMREKTKQDKAPCIEIDGEMLVDTSAEEVEAWMKKKSYLP